MHRLILVCICQPYAWPSNVDEAASLYDDVISRILDEILPTRLTVRRRRPSDPWFDADCRTAKRLTRGLEPAFLAACRRAVKLAVPTLLRRLPLLIQLESYGTTRNVLTVKSATRSVSHFGRIVKSPRDLWPTVARLLGRGAAADDLSTFLLKRWNESGRPRLVQHLRRFVLRRMAPRLPSLRYCHRTTLLLPPDK